jgi:predicted ArsR family transcriptional regulator
MQPTRRHILDILKDRGQATVDDIVFELQRRRGSITPVTVRHHLLRLQQEELITTPDLRRRTSPGRPQHVYSLTQKARDLFPNNYQRLALGLLTQLQKQLPPEGVNVILEGVADQMADEAAVSATSMPERLEMVVDYLNRSGYEAYWEAGVDGYLLHTNNCPYHQIAEQGATHLCDMDMRLVSALLGVVPRRKAYVGDGDDSCSYFIPANL